MINRAALLVLPAQPYVDWAANLGDSELLPNTEGEGTVYLIPEGDGEEWLEEILEQVFEFIFENELHAWHEDASAWPEPRTLDMFKEWFNYQVHSAIIDLTDGELVDDEEDE